MLKIISIVSVIIVLSIVFYFQAWFVTDFREKIGNLKFFLVFVIGVMFVIFLIISLSR